MLDVELLRKMKHEILCYVSLVFAFLLLKSRSRMLAMVIYWTDFCQNLFDGHVATAMRLPTYNGHAVARAMAEITHKSALRKKQ